MSLLNGNFCKFKTMNGNLIINARIKKLTERKAELLTMKKSERRGELHSVEDIIARLKRWNRELEMSQNVPL